MNLYLRLLMTLSRCLLGERIDHRAELVSRFRVWPHDIDAFGHMNNGRYLQIMDVARTGWMARVGVVTCMWQNRWTAVIGGGVVRYRHALRPFQRYEVRTRLLSWDDRWWYLEHVFFDEAGRQAAIGVSRAGLREGRRWLSTEAMVDALSPGAVSPEPPEYLARWLALEEEMHEHSFRPEGEELVLVPGTLAETTALQDRPVAETAR